MARTTPVHSGYTIINGSGTGTNGKRIDVWAEYTLGQQSVTGNYTPITVYFYAALNPSYTSTTKLASGLNSALKVDGNSGSGVSNGAYDFTASTRINALGSYSGNIAHASDGTKKVTISGSFTTKSTYISGGSVSADIDLPVIPRASTLGATAANIGETSMIAVSVKSTAYSHSIAYEFGQLTGYINSDGLAVSAESKFTATSIAFAVPESFYGQIPNAPSGICTLTCRTYSGSTQIGQAHTATFTVTAKESNCKPVVTGTVVDINSETLKLTGNNKKLVKYHSTARCTISAQAKNSASIKSKTVAGTAVTGNSLDIPKVQTGSIEFRAVDSRGYSGTDTDEEVTMVDYIPLSNLACVSRDDATGGNATVTLSGSYYNGSFGAVQNYLTVQYRINGGDWIPYEANCSFAGGKYSGRLPLTDLDYTQSYKLEVKVKDALMEQIKVLNIQKGMPVFDWGENDFCFHVPVSAPGVNGVYLRAARVWNGQRSLQLQTRFRQIANGDSRQSISLFGWAGGWGLVSGVIGISDAGGSQWIGTDGVAVSTMNGTGQITVTLPNGAYDYFVLTSAYEFEVI